ncbi:EamA family transporter RarD [Adlercreutzia murintestinalis]|uniref:EamA family transporter RarD n=1 Tax=Adlercreutzia murintestinalis TaxID=2941325 RepID=UPI002041F1E5|nr:EamA family transporter RarD [Adlercreutzia murintestinalis]
MEVNAETLRTRTRRGIAAAFCCYIMWGLFPLYWKLLDHVNSFEIIAQRMIWCFVFTALICFIGRWDFIGLLKDRRALRYLIPAAMLITVNWSTYIFAVDMDRIVETSIGYYLNPLVSIVLGLIIFKERMTPLQWIAVALCIGGLSLFIAGYGEIPWISIILAISFGLYGAVKKKGGYPPVEAIAVESAVMMPFAVIFAVVLAATTGGCAFLGDTGDAAGWTTTALLIGGGAITAVPLILFATAANSIPLVLLGFIQYVSPTIALIIGVLVNGEPFTVAHAVCFGCIWAGLALVGIDAVRTNVLAARHTKAEHQHNR